MYNQTASYIPVSVLNTNGEIMLAKELIPVRLPWTIPFPYIKLSAISSTKFSIFFSLDLKRNNSSTKSIKSTAHDRIFTWACIKVGKSVALLFTTLDLALKYDEMETRDHHLHGI